MIVDRTCLPRNTPEPHLASHQSSSSIHQSICYVVDRRAFCFFRSCVQDVAGVVGWGCGAFAFAWGVGGGRQGQGWAGAGLGRDGRGEAGRGGARWVVLEGKEMRE